MMGPTTRGILHTSRLLLTTCQSVTPHPYTASTRLSLRGVSYPVQLVREGCTFTAALPTVITHNHYNHRSVPILLKEPLYNYNQTRPITTTPLSLLREEPGRIKKLIKKMGWLDHSKSKLKRSGCIMYESAVANTLSMDFFEVFDLPDTFFSWFLVLELHVWMLMVRLMAEGEEGRFTRNVMLEAMWEDCDTRSKKLGAANLTARNEQIQYLLPPR